MRSGVASSFVALRSLGAAGSLLVLPLSFQACDRPAPDATVTLDFSERHQRIIGWEASASATEEADLQRFLKYRDEMFDRIVFDLGVTRLRLAVRAGAENDRDYYTLHAQGRLDYPAWRAKRYSTVNDNDDPGSINWSGFFFSELDRTVELVVNPIRERVARTGERPFINLCYVAFTGQARGSGPYVHQDPNEYAEFVEAIWRHMRDRWGWVPDSLEVILEPDNVREWNGRLIGRAIVEVARRLKAAGFDAPRFVAPSNTNMSKAVGYFFDMMAVPGTRELLSEFSYHRYGGVSGLALRTIAEAARHYQVDTAMLEWIGADAATLHQDLKVGGNAAWSQFVIAGTKPDAGGAYLLLDGSAPAGAAVQLAARTGQLRQYFKYIRPGAVRIGAESTDDRMDPVAFENAAGTTVVVIRCLEGGRVNVSGLRAGTYGRTFSTASTSGHTLPDVTVRDGGLLAADMPAAGVITVFGKR